MSGLTSGFSWKENTTCEVRAHQFLSRTINQRKEPCIFLSPIRHEYPTIMRLSGRNYRDVNNKNDLHTSWYNSNSSGNRSGNCLRKCINRAVANDAIKMWRCWIILYYKINYCDKISSMSVLLHTEAQVTHQWQKCRQPSSQLTPSHSPYAAAPSLPFAIQMSTENPQGIDFWRHKS